MPRQYDYTETSFSGPAGLRTLAERDDLQAETKDVYAVADGDHVEGDIMAQLQGGDSEFLGSLPDYQAVYNTQSGAIHDIVTDDYEVINPVDFIGPLCDELTDRDRGDLSGRVYLRDDGGAAHCQFLFTETDQIWLPNRGRSDPVRVGFEMTWSHDSGMSVSVKGFAQDTNCENSIREVTSPINVKHSGDVDERISWRGEWARVLDEMGAFSETLADMIEEAMERHIFDLESTQPWDDMWFEHTEPLNTIETITPPGPLSQRDVRGFHAFYELLGFPSYLATAMAENLCEELREADDPREVTVWAAFSAATYGLTHEYRGASTNAGDKFRTANEILLNPDLAVEEADMEALSRAEPDDSESMWEDAEYDPADNVGEGLRQYSEQSRQLQESFGGDD